ncbi:nuclear factor of activated T-cells, cytoplasmic 2 isoform X1 [Syngnathoides biaculeatus]|uniref:nuclear factor of activated T-cells, cytoplasmic 2 isoform X1 n=1 Tax=Syngnathoides biaculeatus TaxID=300417 RepID=UPI002ADE84B0|nr:nuclear factor of activated T-cells, cytoplasmic 2 isoform X1 [Syngnathoides biaculeatus]
MASDISQEEWEFSDLFFHYGPGEDFPAGQNPDDVEQPTRLEVSHHGAFIKETPSNCPGEESSSEAVLDPTDLGTTSGIISAPSPRIEITPSGDSITSQALQPSPGSKALGAYRECASPASSNSSSGWPADGGSPSASPCISPSRRGACATELSTLDLCPFLQGIQTSSTHSSPGASVTDELFLLSQHQDTPSPLEPRRCRSVSPQGKRTRDLDLSCPGASPIKQRSRSPSPIPLPYNLLGFYPIHQNQAHGQPQTQAQASELVPEDKVSILKLSQEAVQGAHGPIPNPDCMYREGHELERVSRLGSEVISGSFCVLPTLWPPDPNHVGALGGLSLAPLPSLEWPLPSQSSQYELMIKTQPRSHHRAHYETEGSRGAVKTSNGGHPEVQLHGYRGTAPLVLQVFIGTADERLLKPHAFYQAHRITGKTVTTPSSERMVNGTKVLEIPLEPKNNMRVVIDCVGILKRRNADIELRNGETDVGRKNTRVRLVFRVHVPQPGGHLVSLQVASHPIECSQHSALEIPVVKSQSLDRCSILGGQQMLLTGHNFTYDSRVIFSERTQDGQQIWEVEATADREKSQSNMLLVAVPPYRDQNICHPVKVNFNVINGKKKRSELQHFIYTPLMAIKTEPLDDWQLNVCDYSDTQLRPDARVKTLLHRLEQGSNLHPFGGLASHPLDYQPVIYQSRAGNLINNGDFYHPANQLYYHSYAATVHGAILKASNPANIHSSLHLAQGSDVKTAIDKLSPGPRVRQTFQAYSSTRHQNSVQNAPSLGKSPPSIFVQGDICDKSLTQTGSNGADKAARTQERVTIKQEDLTCVNLEDVNDIIRRDLRDHHSDAGVLQHPRL